MPPPKEGEPLAAISDKEKPTGNGAAADDVQKYQNVPKAGLNFQTSLCPLSHDHNLRFVALGTLKIGNLVILSLPFSQLKIFYSLVSAASMIFISSSRDLE